MIMFCFNHSMCRKKDLCPETKNVLDTLQRWNTYVEIMEI